MAAVSYVTVPLSGVGHATSTKECQVQGVVKLYDPATRDGVILTEVGLVEYDLAPDALAGSVFRMLRPGQRVIFDLDVSNRATRLRLGSEVDMGTPSWLESQ